MGDEVVRARAEKLEVFDFPDTPWTDPGPLAESRVAIVTTAGLRADGGHGWAPGDQGFVVLPGDRRDLTLGHTSQNFDRTAVLEDLNVVYPLDRLAELAERGVIGSVATNHLAFMGAQRDHTLTTLRTDSGPAAAELLRRDGVDVVLLTPV
ncbi:MAG: glycine/sarcosine/betaine reductase selenoprotein B family protein [Acidimicrobiales bacterium]